MKAMKLSDFWKMKFADCWDDNDKNRVWKSDSYKSDDLESETCEIRDLGNRQ